MTIGFSVNMHDKDGDSFDDCIILHLDSTTMIRVADVEELDKIITDLNDIKKELVDNYGL
tara:strand:- start:11790 stop:11969 length:180 start_codon:yes stop_codon:yes gene_type:complete